MSDLGAFKSLHDILWRPKIVIWYTLDHVVQLSRGPPRFFVSLYTLAQIRRALQCPPWAHQVFSFSSTPSHNVFLP